MTKIEPCTLVFFGAGGNLSRKKLIPSLFHLEMLQRLPQHLVILGCDIVEYERDAWLDGVGEILRDKHGKDIDEAALKRFCARLHYFAVPPNDDDAYARLQTLLDDDPKFPPNVVYYMAVRPADYPGIVDKLGNVGLLKENNGWRRVVIEKPFGYDLHAEIGRAHV